MRLSHVPHTLTPFGGRITVLAPVQPVPIGPLVYWMLRRRVPPKPLPGDIIDAVRLRLLATPSLSALVDIYLRNSPREPVYPFMVINPIRETPVITNSQTDDMSWAEIQFSIMDEDETQGYTLREAAFYALHPKNNPGPLQWRNGSDSGAPILTGKWEFPQPYDGTGGQNVWGMVFAARFYVTRGLS